MEFKGTKGKWYRGIGTVVVSMSSQIKVSNALGLTYEEAKANALLISKAPEMLHMLKDIKDYLGSDKRSEVEQLIKEATEL